MDTVRAAYDELYVYTIGRPGFILQHVVDAFAVQTANKDTRPTGVVFGWSACISTSKSSFLVVRSKKRTRSSDIGNESGRASFSRRIAAA